MPYNLGQKPTQKDQLLKKLNKNIDVITQHQGQKDPSCKAHTLVSSFPIQVFLAIYFFDS
jgi:hypothetical protein